MENAFGINWKGGRNAFVIGEGGLTLFHCICPISQYHSLLLLKKIAHSWNKYERGEVPYSEFHTKDYGSLLRMKLERKGVHRVSLISALCDMGIIKYRVPRSGCIRYEKKTRAISTYYKSFGDFVDDWLKEWQETRIMKGAKFLVWEERNRILSEILGELKSRAIIQKNTNSSRTRCDNMINDLEALGLIVSPERKIVRGGNSVELYTSNLKSAEITYRKKQAKDGGKWQIHFEFNFLLEKTCKFTRDLEDVIMGSSIPEGVGRAADSTEELLFESHTLRILEATTNKAKSTKQLSEELGTGDFRGVVKILKAKKILESKKVKRGSKLQVHQAGFRIARIRYRNGKLTSKLIWEESE